MSIRLRPITIADLPNLVKYANNLKVSNNLTDGFPSPFTEAKGKMFIHRATHSHPNHILAIDLDGELIGAIGIHAETDVYRKNSEMGYWLAEPFWGKGYMTQAVQLMVEYGFQNFDINRIFARPFGMNIGSQKVLEKAGFTLEAHLKSTFYKNGVYLDELIYAVRRKPN